MALSDCPPSAKPASTRLPYLMKLGSISSKRIATRVPWEVQDEAIAPDYGKASALNLAQPHLLCNSVPWRFLLSS